MGEESDLVLAVITDVIHAHQNGQKLPVFLKVQALNGEKSLRCLHNSMTGSQRTAACTSYPLSVSIKCLVCPGRLLTTKDKVV